jgi:hypothetical protein
MSRGISKLQRTIIGLLDGSLNSRVYRAGGVFITRELLEELREAGVMSEEQSRKSAMDTVLRACHSLVRRGLLVGERTIDTDDCRLTTISWQIPKKPAAAKRRTRKTS